MQTNREEFIKVLGRVKPALAKGDRTKVAAFSHFWFDEKTLVAYDGGFGIKLNFKSELSCGIPGGPLLGLLGTSALEEVTLEPSGTTLQVKLGKSISKLATLEAEQKVWTFPLKLPKGATPTALDENFAEALRRSLFIKASPATRVEHHGVMVSKVKNDLVLHSTDSTTMTQVRLPGLGKGVSFERTLLPREFAEELVSQLPEGADLYVLSDCLIAQGEDISFYSNLLDLGNADDMSAVVARLETKHAAASPLPAGLEGALARAEILAGREEPVVSLSVEEKGTTLTVSGDYALGSLKEALTLEAKLPPAKISVRASHLRRGLAYSDTISVTKDTLLLRGDSEFTYVVAAHTA